MTANRGKERHFDCTICGKCCYGMVPLTISEALTYADRFPLAIVWTPLRRGTRSYDHTVRLGASVRLPNKKEVALRITPTAYIPPSLPCPALIEDTKCNIHDEKPLRCRAMPFSPYREESHQSDLLIPRAGWECDTSTDAPVVYRDGKVIPRGDFDAELGALENQAETIKKYADWLLASVPDLMPELMRAVKKKSGDHVVVSFFSLLPRLPDVDVVEIARKQSPVVNEFFKRTRAVPAVKKYHEHYRDYAAELERVIRQ